MSLRGSFRVAGMVGMAAVAAAAIAVHGAAGASTSTAVSGTFAVTDPGTTTCATNGAPFILRCTTTGFTIEYSGSLTGTSVIDFGGIINCKTSTGVAAGTETFTGSVAGVGSGSLTWKKTASSGIDCATGELFNFSGRGAITAGTGDLAALNGELLFGPDIYSGELH